MNEVVHLNKIHKSGYYLFPIACTVAALSFIDINYAFLLGFFAIPTSIGLLVKGIKHFSLLSMLSKLLTFFGCFILLVASPVGCSFHTNQTKSDLQSLILNLDAHKKTHGTYPSKLSGLKQKAPQCYSPKRDVLYLYDKDGNEFMLICVTFAFNKLSYNSRTKVWSNHD